MHHLCKNLGILYHQDTPGTYTKISIRCIIKVIKVRICFVHFIPNFDGQGAIKRQFQENGEEHFILRIQEVWEILEEHIMIWKEHFIQYLGGFPPGFPIDPVDLDGAQKAFYTDFAACLFFRSNNFMLQLFTCCSSLQNHSKSPHTRVYTLFSLTILLVFFCVTGLVGI